MTPQPAACSPNDSISHVADLMWDFDVSALPVTDRTGRVVGIVTRQAIRTARESSVAQRSISSVMTTVAEGAQADERRKSPGS